MKPLGAVSTARLRRPPAWLRHWEFWLALALAALLRLWQIDLTGFLDDQAALMTLARTGITHGALPITANPSSIGAYNPPLSVYLLMPFAALTLNPFPATVSIAVWNVIGVALCYPFALRYFGRRVAAVGTLLFATSGAAVNYSRFIWQPNYLPPLLVLWAITLYLGCVQERRRWFMAHMIVFLIAILLHSVAVLLLPVTLVAIALAPQRPRLGEYAIVALAGVVLATPSLLWEALSGGYDVRALYHAALHGSQINLAVFNSLYQLLGAPGTGYFGPTAPYTRLSPIYPAINIAAAFVFALGYLALTIRIAHPALVIWRTVPAAPSIEGDDTAPALAGAYRTATPRERIGLLRRWMIAVYRGLRADAHWRAELLLWLWVSTPVILLIRHSVPPYVHYLLILFPAVFLVAGYAAVDVPRWLAAVGNRFARTNGEVPRWVTPVVVGALTLLIAAQAGQSLVYVASLSDGSFTALNGPGYPLSELAAVDRSISFFQRATHAASVEIITPTAARYRAPLDYLLVSEHPHRISLEANCLALLPTAAGSTLIVTTIAPSTQSRAAAFLPLLPSARLVGRIVAAGGPPFRVYLAQGTTPLLPYERTLDVSYHDTQGDALTLVGAATEGVGVIRLRWRITSVPAGHWLRVGLETPQGKPLAQSPANPLTPVTLQVHDDCQPSQWSAGETLFTWLSVPAGTAFPLTIGVSAGRLGLFTASLGPLRVLADRPAQTTLIPLQTEG